MALEIKRLSDALGAEVTGLDPTDVSPDEGARLSDAFLEYHLLCIRSVPLNASDFVRFSRIFGEPKLHVLKRNRLADVPEVTLMDSTYHTPADKPNDLAQDRRSAWHTDDSYLEVPAKATLLQGISVPESGGQTRFCNTRLALSALPESEAEQFSGLKVVHGYDTQRAPARAKKRTQDEQEQTPEVVHPLIRTHEDTGAGAFFFNPNRTDRVVGMERRESDRLLDRVYEQITQNRFRYDHEWRAGDILVWDNRCLVHSVNMDFSVGQQRIHHRILISGDRPQ